MQAIQGMDLVRAQLLAEIVYRTRRRHARLDLLRPASAPRCRSASPTAWASATRRLRLWLEARQPAASDELDHFLSRLFGEVLSQPGFGFHTSYDAGQVAANLIESVQKFRWVAGPALE